MLDGLIVALYIILEVTYPSGIHMEATLRMTGFDSMSECKAAAPQIRAEVGNALWRAHNREVFCVLEGTTAAREGIEEEN